MMKTHVGWIIIVCFFSALIAGFFVLKNSTSGEPDISFTPVQMATPAADGATKSSTSSPRVVPVGLKEYHNEQFGISLLYPQDFSPQETIDHGPELTVAFQSGAGEPGFQIYASPIDGTQVTGERFLRDEPSGVKLESRDITIDGTQAVAFQGFDAHVGKTHEIWFIHGHFLYEVTTYSELSSWLTAIMQTWRFL